MTECASGRVKHISASRNGFRASRRIGRGHRRRQETSEEGEFVDRADCSSSRLTIGVGNVIWNRRKLASWRFISLGLKQFVGDTHFDVVCLAGKQKERFVLSFPSEAGDRAVIAVVVSLPRDRMASEDNVGPSHNVER